MPAALAVTGPMLRAISWIAASCSATAAAMATAVSLTPRMVPDPESSRGAVGRRLNRGNLMGDVAGGLG
jgi:hypothetical protein